MPKSPFLILCIIAWIGLQSGPAAVLASNAEALFERANQKSAAGDFDGAIDDYAKAISLDPNFAKAYANRGCLWYSRGDFGKAIIDLDKAIAIDPELPSPYFIRGNIWLQKQSYDSAITDYNRAIALKPDFHEAYYKRGVVCRKQGRYDSAIVDFTRAIQINPKDAESYLERGYTRYLQGQFRKTIDDYAMAIDIDPTFHQAYNNLAWIYSTCPSAKLRDGKKGLALARKAIELGNVSAPKLDTLAAAYAETGDFKNAVLYQKKALRMLKKQETKGDRDAFRKSLEAYQAGKPWRDHR